MGRHLLKGGAAPDPEIFCEQKFRFFDSPDRVRIEGEYPSTDLSSSRISGSRQPGSSEWERPSNDSRSLQCPSKGCLVNPPVNFHPPVKPDGSLRMERNLSSIVSTFQTPTTGERHVVSH